jgi:hypothetical protein
VALIKTFQPKALDEMGALAVTETIFKGHHMLGIKVLGEDKKTLHSIIVVSNQEACGLIDLLTAMLKRGIHVH